MTMQEITVLDRMTDDTELLNDPTALRSAASDNGYLHFKQLVPESALIEVRRDICALLAKYGWLDLSSDPIDAIVHPDLDQHSDFLTHPQYDAYYKEVLSTRSFHQLALHDDIMSMFQALFGETVLAHSRNILRTIMPGDAKFTTPPHQDYLHIQGSVNTWTLWMPLGDCPEELGGLAVAPGSYKNGMMKHVGAYGAGGAGIEMNADQAWVGNEMMAGDVILLHSQAVHQGRNNTTPDRIRLSCDYRYQPLSEPVVAASLEPHMSCCSWDELYSDWDDTDPLKYYWKSLDTKFVEFHDMYPDA